MYYPAQRHSLDLALIQRDYVLPEGAIGTVEVNTGQRVEIRDVIARGIVPSRHVILEVAQHFRLKRPLEMFNLLKIDPEADLGAMIEQGTLIAEQRGKKLVAPISGIVAYLGEGRVILKETPVPQDLEAGVMGTVVEVYEGRGVAIQTVGALVQGAWGNGRRAIGTLRMEPADGLESIFGDDSLLMQYRGAIVVTKRTLRETALMAAIDQGLLGIIAPSMDSTLRMVVSETELAVMLLVGFGDVRLSTAVVSLFEGLDGRQATIVATTPDRMDTQRPEVLINIPTRAEQRPAMLDTNIALRRGANVRLTANPYLGSAGRVVDLPKTPTLLDNGLRVLCARVELLTGETVFVPLANLEFLGK
jgi:hypothetical protein